MASDPTIRPRFTLRDWQLIHAAVYVYSKRERNDRDVAELLERIEKAHDDAVARAAVRLGDNDGE